MSVDSGAQPGVAVVFLTRLCAKGFPVDANVPACLLPLGWQTLAEHALDQLHLAGFSEIHLVSHDASGRLRRALGSGDRWGLKLHWHVTDSALHPYRILRHLQLGEASDVLVGHADRFVAAPLLASLRSHRGVLALETAQAGSVWSGWSCLPTEVLRGLGSQAPWPTLCDSMMALQGFFPAQWPQETGDADWLVVDTPELYLQAQQRWMQAGWLERAPLSWIRHAWGLQHPAAKVKASDDWTGPVVIGPGCVVQDGARLTGPVTLGRDVWLGSTGEVRNSVILERSFISAGLTLENCLVNGTRLWRDGVSIELRDADAILTSLSSDWSLTLWLERAWGRLCAGLLLALVWPLCLVVWARQRLSGRTTGWQQALPRWVRAWLEIARGRWGWWGIRARSPEQLAALPDTWQHDLQRGRVGLWHLPANDDRQAEVFPEQEAAADLFWLLQMRASFVRLCFYRLGVLRRALLSRASAVLAR